MLPIISLGLNHKVSSERVSTGIPRLDAMLSGRGFYRGSSILLTGTPGTGKSIVSAMNSWLLLRDFEGNGERNRVLYVIKARGMVHSNQVREFLISNRGIDLVDAYIGPSGVLTGASRVAQAAREKAEALTSQQEAARRKRELVRKRATLEQRIAALRSEYETEESELRCLDQQAGTQTRLLTAERTELARLRQADATVTARTNSNSRSKGKR